MKPALCCMSLMLAVLVCAAPAIAQQQRMVTPPRDLIALQENTAPAPASVSTASGHRSEPEANDSAKKQEAEGGTEAFRNSPSVQKLGGMLGMKPAVASSVFEWLNFLVLAAAVLFFAAKALPSLLRKRTEGIQKGIVEARSATEEARLRLSAVEERLSKLDGEIASLRGESERSALADEEQLKAQMETEKARILQAAEQEIAAASAQAHRSLREYAAQIAVDRAGRSLEITPEDDRWLIKNFVSKLNGEGSRN